MNYSVTKFRDLTAEIQQNVSVIWRGCAELTSGQLLNSAATPWFSAIELFDYNEWTVGYWYWEQVNESKSENKGLNIFSQNADAYVVVEHWASNAITPVVSFKVENVSPSTILAKVNEKLSKIFTYGSLPTEYIGITNIMIKVKEELS